MRGQCRILPSTASSPYPLPRPAGERGNKGGPCAAVKTPAAFDGAARAAYPSGMDRITFNPEQCGGRPCIRGMRIRVKDVLDLLAAGVGEAEILADFPYLEREDIQAALAFAAEGADHPVLVAAQR